MEIRRTQIAAVLGTIVVCAQAYTQGGGRIIHPPEPVEEAKNARVVELIDRAKQLVRSNDDQGAIAKLQEAAAVEATMANFHARAKYALASMYVKQNRIPMALEAYRATLTWNPAANFGFHQGDLNIGSHAGIDSVMEYAILLAKEGRAEDAKAMYYLGVRAVMLQPQGRSQEPAPFLIVFDPDPEGIYWEYSPQRLEAAVLMVQAMLASGVQDFATNTWTSSRQFIERVRALAPDWFYPVLYMANQRDYGSPEREQLLAQADALAKPGLEERYIEDFRRAVAAYLAESERQNLVPGVDHSPMIEGAERRKRMQCLRPNEQILRRLSIERPGG
jgi:hypothetical protein